MSDVGSLNDKLQLRYICALNDSRKGNLSIHNIVDPTNEAEREKNLVQFALNLLIKIL